MNVHDKLYPSFGGRTRPEAYYAFISSAIAALRPATPLREIAEILNRDGLKTPRNLDWTKTRVVAFLRDNRIS
ncbi:recombinase family protein [Massilia sp. AB1]|uniref:recombinase family protein n=1 Tax=Massilia sp. AB1 TaxID=2823371 RepID=UPI001B81E168|nr:recombinase family protein [Massilia sp. AB1]MBQ5939866.1 recombinase family protein [Massilia sp. AB1]